MRHLLITWALVLAILVAVAAPWVAQALNVIDTVSHGLVIA